MANDRDGAVLRQIRALYSAGNCASLTDGQLLERFATRDRELGERAFAALVERHGPMVLHVCRGILHDRHDAEDAFQATFLVLVRKASTLLVRGSLAPWLHGVACRVAIHSRSATALRRRHERQAAEIATRKVGADVGDESGATIHAEIERLPARYRVPIVLCDLGSLTHEQAARQLGLPVGTVKSRLARGRLRLRDRLLRRGLAPSAGVLAGSLSADAASVFVPSALVDRTAVGAMRFLAGKTVAGAGSATVVAMTEGVLRMMFVTKLKMVAVVLLAIGAAAGGGTLFSSQTQAGKPGVAQAENRETLNEAKPGAEPPAGQSPRQAADLSGSLGTELNLLSEQLKTKQVELEQAKARRELALAVYAINFKLRQTDRTKVSDEAIGKAESEAKLAAKEVERLEAEVRAAETRLNYARRLQSDPERLREYLDEVNPPDNAALARRLREVERKLEQILKASDASKRENPIGDFPPRKR